MPVAVKVLDVTNQMFTGKVKMQSAEAATYFGWTGLKPLPPSIPGEPKDIIDMCEVSCLQRV